VKITKLSLAAIAAMTLTTSAMADVDFKIGGQAVVYYETNDGGDKNDLFGQSSSQANAGLQLNANADLGNGFGLGLQGSALSTWGLEDHLVSGVKQGGLGAQGDTALSSTDYFSITKAYLTKKVANTTIKAGRQELPKSLSPLAFSEGWNVFKNTFDAVVAINTDIPDTTVVGAYVSRSNNNGGADTGTFDALHSGSSYATGLLDADGNSIDRQATIDNAFMLTVANKSSKLIQPTLTYYALKNIELRTSADGAAVTTQALGKSGSALWANVDVDAGLPVKLALQGGKIDPKNGLKKTNTYGAKISGKFANVALSLAYTDVDEGAVSIQNVGTGIKTPLFTQMIYNQNFISSDASTTVLKAAMPVGPGKLIAQYGITDDTNTGGTSATENDYNELDVIYKTKLSGMNVFAAYVMRDSDLKTLQGGDDKANIIRVWTRYNF